MNANKLLGSIISCHFEKVGDEILLTVPQALIDETVSYLNSNEQENLDHAFGDLLVDVVVNGTRLIIKQLAYHVALYVNPTKDYGYDDRYCICSKEVALLAIEKFRETNEVWYWQKHHNKNLRCVGNHIYGDNGLCEPEYALRQVPWNAEDLRKAFPMI